MLQLPYCYRLSPQINAILPLPTFQKVDRKQGVSATSLYVYIDPLIMCRVSTFRLPDTVLGVVSDYVISLLVAIQLL